MKRAGKNNKVLKGMHPLDRHGFERFGDLHNPEVALFIGFVAYVLGLEASPDPSQQNAARSWWLGRGAMASASLHRRLENELRHAVLNHDGRFFRSLADLVEARGRPAVDPARAWICRLFSIHESRVGRRTEQTHKDKTPQELYEMFRAAPENQKIPKDQMPSLHTFRNLLRELGAEYQGKGTKHFKSRS